MINVATHIEQLVSANHILANEGVLDAYGHVSIRHPQHPERYLLSRSRSPELVTAADIMEFALDGTPVSDATTQPYLERFIHGAIYEARPDIHAVVHSHADDVLPFTVCPAPFRCVVHTASGMGAEAPVWDIDAKFGDTNLLVVNMDQGRDLARTLGTNSVVLMRGHGFSVGSPSLQDVVKAAIYMPLNARVLFAATLMGGAKALSKGEIAARSKALPDSPQMRRAWEYWERRARRDKGGGETQ